MWTGWAATELIAFIFSTGLGIIHKRLSHTCVCPSFSLSKRNSFVITLPVFFSGCFVAHCYCSFVGLYAARNGTCSSFFLLLGPVCSSPAKEAPVDAAMLLLQGKRHLLVQDYPSAVCSLQEACERLGALYGETAPECGEAYLCYGKALLELARQETGVLGNALGEHRATGKYIPLSSVCCPAPGQLYLNGLFAKGACLPSDHFSR